MHGPRFDGSVERQRRVERDVSVGDLKLEVKDEIVERRVSEVAVLGRDGVLELANLLVGKGVHAFDISLEMPEIFFIHRLFRDVL